MEYIWLVYKDEKEPATENTVVLSLASVWGGKERKQNKEKTIHFSFSIVISEILTFSHF